MRNIKMEYAKNICTIPFLRSILSVKKCVLYTKNIVCNAWISVIAENCVVELYAIFRCCLSCPDIFLERSDTATNGKFNLHKMEIDILKKTVIQGKFIVHVSVENSKFIFPFTNQFYYFIRCHANGFKNF